MAISSDIERMDGSMCPSEAPRLSQKLGKIGRESMTAMVPRPRVGRTRTAG
jgi:hypothetical protein